MITYLRVKETKTALFSVSHFVLLADDYLSPSEGDENAREKRIKNKS